VVVRVEAAPINPSDLGLLFGPADVTTIRQVIPSELIEEPWNGIAAESQPGTGRSLRASVPEHLLNMIKARIGKPVPCGNEGSGIVVQAGKAPEAQALLGKCVGVVGGRMYSTYRKVKAAACLVFPDGVAPRECASWFVNPLTALGFVETMKKEGHKALVHTAAASNLGQMLNKICLLDGVDVVNIVRKTEQVAILMNLGAKYIVNSSSPTFIADLTNALLETGATLGFDATGGGKMADAMLTCMEAAAQRSSKGYSVYGSGVHKQVYIYGGLDRGVTVLKRNYGMAWGLGGWLLTPFLQNAGRETQNRMRARVAEEITTTFSSSYTCEVSLQEALDVANVQEYIKQATGTKYLINPSKADAMLASKL